MGDFETIRAQAQQKWEANTQADRPRFVLTYDGTTKAMEVDHTLSLLQQKVGAWDNRARVSLTGCLGLCWAEPILEVHLPGQPPVLYANVMPDNVEALLERVLAGEVVADRAVCVRAESAYEGIPALAELPIWKLQTRRLMALTGTIDPEDIDDYLANGGYSAAAKAITEMTPAEVVQLVKDSGLSGRGGAAFPAGLKWSFLLDAKVHPKYVICNADEGDAGAWVNRVLLEGDPHLIIEGILIGAYAMQADVGYVYIRAEYPLAVRRMRRAVEQAVARNLLGKNILGTDFSFEIRVLMGAGAYLCGEETALMDSIEGKRGMPRLKPPFPAAAGVFGKPSNINNVETFANAPFILREGAEEYKKLGTEKATGSKMFSLSGDVNRVCVVEVPLGFPVKRMLEECCGGMKEGSTLKAIQPGGPLSGFMPAEMALGVGAEPGPFTGAGILLGSGGIVFMDQRTCIVDMSRYFLNFVGEESCARCTTCRIGAMRYVDILDRMKWGRGREEDLQVFPVLSRAMQNSFCVHGKFGPTSINSATKFFQAEFDAHINDHVCPAGVCNFERAAAGRFEPEKEGADMRAMAASYSG
jgi:NADH-quinone oxidoreductase subunit F